MPFKNSEKSVYYQDLTIPENYTDINRNVRISRFQQMNVEISSAQLAELGVPYEYTLKLGYVYLLNSVRIHFYRPIKAMEKIKLTTWARGFKRAKIYRDFQTEDKDKNIIAELSSIWVLANANTHKIENPQDANLNVPFNPDINLNISEISKIRSPKDMPLLSTRKIKYSDIDFNGHVGNFIYADIVCDECNLDLYKYWISDYQIYYRQEVFLSDIIDLFGQLIFENDKPVFYMTGKKENKTCFESRLELEKL